MLSRRADLFDDELKSNCCLACTGVFVFPASAASEYFMTYCGFNICFNKTPHKNVQRFFHDKVNVIVWAGYVQAMLFSPDCPPFAKVGLFVCSGRFVVSLFRVSVCLRESLRLFTIVFSLPNLKWLVYLRIQLAKHKGIHIRFKY